nr:MAG TPA: TCP family transcription factor [Caudoviricetes sp.]
MFILSVLFNLNNCSSRARARERTTPKQRGRNRLL